MHIKKFLLATAVAAMATIGGGAASAGDYSAIAIGGGGVGWSEHYQTMEGARKAAIQACRRNGGSCSVSVAERSNWYFAAGYCNGVPYAAASRKGYEAAAAGIAYKGSLDYNNDCYIEHSF